MAQPQQKKSHTMLIVAIVIVAVIVVVGVIALVFLAGEVANRSSADITINVYTTHVLESIDYIVYVGGIQVTSGSIDPGYYHYFTYTYSWFGESADVVTVSATSSGGGFGSMTDSEDLVVADGGAYTVSLYV